jgi:ribonuclease HIII
MNFYIGVDESGKGDFFGPLVIAGIVSSDEINQKLITLGVRDSKKLSDKKIVELAEEIKKICIYEIVVINPKRYNELTQKLNLNRVLAWGHARVIENLLGKAESEKIVCTMAISDKFGDEHYLIESLMTKGKKIELVQRHKAEADPAVASASILARNEFLSRLKLLSEKYKIEFPRGASSKVVEVAGDFVKKYGRGELNNVAKIHFRTSKLIGV